MPACQETRFGVVGDESAVSLIVISERQLKRYGNGTAVMAKHESPDIEHESEDSVMNCANCFQDGGFCYSCCYFVCCGWCDRRDRKDCSKHLNRCCLSCWTCCWCLLVAVIEAI